MGVPKRKPSRSRQRMLALRGEAAEQRREIKQQIHEKGPARRDAMDQLAREIDHVEAQAEAYDPGSQKLADQFAQLESSDAVESELTKLRDKLGKSA
mgnify:CR=1 FL=1